MFAFLLVISESIVKQSNWEMELIRRVWISWPISEYLIKRNDFGNPEFKKILECFSEIAVQIKYESSIFEKNYDFIMKVMKKCQDQNCDSDWRLKQLIENSMETTKSANIRNILQWWIIWKIRVTFASFFSIHL